MSRSLGGTAAIAGIGQTEFSKESGRSELQLNGITAAVRHVRGTSYNQFDNVEHILVTSGTGVPTSGLILAPAG